MGGDGGEQGGHQQALEGSHGCHLASPRCVSCWCKCTAEHRSARLLITGRDVRIHIRQKRPRLEGGLNPRQSRKETVRSARASVIWCSAPGFLSGHTEIS